MSPKIWKWGEWVVTHWRCWQRNKRWTQSSETPSTRSLSSASAMLLILFAFNLTTLYATSLSLSLWVFIYSIYYEVDELNLFFSTQLSKSAREVSKFASVALVDIDSNEIQVYVKYFDIAFIPSTVFFFNAHHMKMDSGYSSPSS